MLEDCYKQGLKHYNNYVPSNMTKTCLDHLMFKKPSIHIHPFCWHADRGVDLFGRATEKCQMTIKTIYKINSFIGQGTTLSLVEINF